MKKSNKKITRKQAMKKIGDYGKYTLLTALGTYIVLNPERTQATSPEVPGNGF